MHTNLFLAEIIVDDIPAKEHNIETDESGHTSKAECYIQADAGAEYEVSIAILQYDGLVSAWVIIDGKVCHKGLMNSEYPTNLIEGRKVSKYEFQPFVFAPMHTVESGGSQNVQEAGTIRVEFKAARIVGSEDAEYIVDGTEQTAVNEKAKKGALISHVTLFDEARPIKIRKESKRTTVQYTQPHPLAVFKFHYQSREYLELNNHLSNPSTLRHSSTPRPSYFPHFVKDEKPDIRMMEDVKPHHIPIPRYNSQKKSDFVNGEVVDLTGDSGDEEDHVIAVESGRSVSVREESVRSVGVGVGGGMGNGVGAGPRARRRRVVG